MIRIITRRSLDVQYLLDDRALELDGVRDGGPLWHPVGERVPPDDVLNSSPRSATTGYDLIVAAPRPISALLAVGSHDEQVQVVRAHRLAVRSAMQYLERHGVVVRRQILGEIDEHRAHWDRSASFTHGVNRAGEPHLHDHVLVGAVAANYRQVIDARVLKDHAYSADSLYRSELRSELNETLDRDVWRSFGGQEYVSGIDESIRALWPGRANESSDKIHWTRSDIHRSWSRDLSQYEAGPEIKPTARDREGLDPHRVQSALSHESHIRRRDVVAALANAYARGQRAALIEESVTRALPELQQDRERAISRSRVREVDLNQRDQDRTQIQRSRDRASSLSLDRSRDR